MAKPSPITLTLRAQRLAPHPTGWPKRNASVNVPSDPPDRRAPKRDIEAYPSSTGDVAADLWLRKNP
jgi:hypothetical protein